MPWQSSCLHLSFRAENYHQPNADRCWTRPVNLSTLPATVAGQQSHAEVTFSSKHRVDWQYSTCWSVSFPSLLTCGLHVKAGSLSRCCCGCPCGLRLMFCTSINNAFTCSVSAFIGRGNHLFWISSPPSWMTLTHCFTTCSRWDVIRPLHHFHVWLLIIVRFYVVVFLLAFMEHEWESGQLLFSSPNVSVDEAHAAAH